VLSRREAESLNVNRLLLAFAGFAALGVLSWTTLSDQRVRLTTLAILAMFALRVWMRRKDVAPAEKDGDE
jgi:hypothetical protein